jgi:hypothetical protein
MRFLERRLPDMRRRYFTIALLAMGALWQAAAQSLSESPLALVKDVVYNEQLDNRRHGYFEYRVERTIGPQTLVAEEVETRIGRIDRVLTTDGTPLTTERQADEDRRLERLVSDPRQQMKLKRDYDSDEQRIGSMMAMMPDAFFYDYDGVEGENIRLKFRPNPTFRAPSYDTRVFAGLVGTIWINAREKRLARLRGELIEDVQFGYGWLGHVDKGGTFEMVRTQVTPQEWKACLLDVHISGHMMMLKSIGKDQREVHSEFRPVDGKLSLSGARDLLERASEGRRVTRAALDRPRN